MGWLKACARGFLLLGLLGVLPGMARAGEIGVNVYGLSYHFEQSLARRNGHDNQINPGVGLRYRVSGGERFDALFDASLYEDSGRHTARILTAGLAWHASERLRFAANLAAAKSETYNRNRAFIAAFPSLIYEWPAVSLNLAYFPKISRFNHNNTVGFWVTVWPEKW